MEGGGERASEFGRWLAREREREGDRASLLGGFPEVTVLNITVECGMLNGCQGKHTDQTTTAPNGHQEPLYINTNTHSYMCMRIRYMCACVNTLIYMCIVYIYL